MRGFDRLEQGGSRGLGSSLSTPDLQDKALSTNFAILRAIRPGAQPTRRAIPSVRVVYGGGVHHNRPAGLLLAVGCALALGLTFVGFAAVSALGGHGSFSLQIGLVLACFGVVLTGAAIALWQGRRWARGPIIGCALVAGFGFGEFLLSQPWLWLLVLPCLGAVVGAALPSTTAALKRPAPRSERTRLQGWQRYSPKGSGRDD